MTVAKSYETNPLRNVPRADIAALKKAGWSDDRVAAHYNCSDDRVRAYRAKHHIKATPSHNMASMVAAERKIAAMEFAAMAADQGREVELFRGMRFMDDPLAVAREKRFVGERELYRSMTGCSAARCAE